MKTSRRTFLKTGTMAAISAAILPHLAFTTAAGAATVGLQLYSVRDDMMEDPKGSLKKVAEMGYRVVEHGGERNKLLELETNRN